MQVGHLSSRGVFDEQQVQILTEAFEEALRLAEIQDRESLAARAIAERIIAYFKFGERDPRQMARMAAEN
jgi:hypothetical protein